MSWIDSKKSEYISNFGTDVVFYLISQLILTSLFFYLGNSLALYGRHEKGKLGKTELRV